MKQHTLLIDNRSLFEQLCTPERLAQAFKEVKTNKGAPGIDGVTVTDFGTHLNEELVQLCEELLNWNYKPKAVKRVEIPKPLGGIRALGVPCVRDRVVQTGIKQLLEPILEPTFSPNSFGFRPGRNQRQAVEQAKTIVESGKPYVADIDLSKFFDRVNQNRLISRLGKHVTDKRILRLVGQTLRSGVMKDGMMEATLAGVTQGSPLSPLLSNLVLDELDKELEKRGLPFCRYADDCNIFAGSQKAAERIMRNISKFIASRLKLVVNEEKSQVALSDAVKFLGMTIANKTIAISKAAMNHAMTKSKEFTRRGTSLTIKATIEVINKWYVGWSSYYSMTEYPAQLRKIEAHIRRRLRARLVSQQKRRRYLVNKLIKRGANKNRVYNTVYSNRKRWALSKTCVASQAYPNKWFEETLGFKVRSDDQLPHWFEVNKWIKLA